MGGGYWGAAAGQRVPPPCITQLVQGRGEGRAGLRKTRDQEGLGRSERRDKRAQPGAREIAQRWGVLPTRDRDLIPSIS